MLTLFPSFSCSPFFPIIKISSSFKPVAWICRSSHLMSKDSTKTYKGSIKHWNWIPKFLNIDSTLYCYWLKVFKLIQIINQYWITEKKFPHPKKCFKQKILIYGVLAQKALIQIWCSSKDWFMLAQISKQIQNIFYLFLHMGACKLSPVYNPWYMK